MSQPPTHDPLGPDLEAIVVSAFDLVLTPYELEVIRRITLYQDRPDIQVLASLIKRSADAAVAHAVKGSLFGPSA